MTIQTKIRLSKTAQRPLAQIRRETKERFGVLSLLGDPEGNPKVAKNKKENVITFPLNLAPGDESGFEVCPKRTAGCTMACLNTAGNPVYLPAKLQARINRTRLFFQARELFFELLRAEIDAAFRKIDRYNLADRMRFAAGFRLNCTSDLNFERLGRGSAAFGDQSVINYILDRGGRAYDYTKVPTRKPPAGYHLTFSLAENNDADALEFMDGAGGSVAVVFDIKRGGKLPKRYPIAGRWFDVVDGDLHDFRPNDPARVIVGLRAKGRAIGDQSGFVRASALGVFE
jgi:hypothetical protein